LIHLSFHIVNFTKNPAQQQRDFFMDLVLPLRNKQPHLSFPGTTRALLLGQTDPFSLRSFHSGFGESISAIFFAPNQSLICFSRAIAEWRSVAASYYTKSWMLYLHVNPETSLFLYSQTWFMRSLVTHP
jgi:hypothetical protein